MEPILLALWVTTATAGPALAAFVLWRMARETRAVTDASAVRELTAARRTVRDHFVMDRSGGRVDVSCETRRMSQVVVLTVAVPLDVWIEPVRPLRLAQTELGDPAFDRRFECGGDTVLLTAEVRAALIEASRVLSLRIVGGALEGRWSTSHDGRRASPLALTLEPHADRLCAVRQAFPADVDDAWLHTALHDPVAAVRIRAIDHLVRTGSRRASLALAAAANAIEPEVVLAAALHTTDLPLLRHLACEPTLAQDLRRAALAALFEHEDPDALASLVVTIARDPLVTDLVSLLDHHPIEPLVMLAASEIRRWGLGRLTTQARRDVEEALAGLLGRLSPSPAVEDALVHLLGSDDDLAVRTAARALGAMGTGRSVPALRAVRGSVNVDRATAQAIRAIQGRVADQEGGMALVPERPMAGALSPAGVAEAGGLAEVE